MTNLSKLMTSAAAATLIAGGAIAQDLPTTREDAADPAGMSEAEDATRDEVGVTGLAGTEDPNLDTQTPESTERAATTPEIDNALHSMTEAMAANEVVTVFGSDGMPIGTVLSADPSAAGLAELSISLDPTLDVDVRRVTYRGAAEVDPEGRVMLPIAVGEFTDMIHAQTAG